MRESNETNSSLRFLRLLSKIPSATKTTSLLPLLFPHRVSSCQIHTLVHRFVRNTHTHTRAQTHTHTRTHGVRINGTHTPTHTDRYKVLQHYRPPLVSENHLFVTSLNKKTQLQLAPIKQLKEQFLLVTCACVCTFPDPYLPFLSLNKTRAVAPPSPSGWNTSANGF